MKIKFFRKRNALTGYEFIDSEVLNANSVALYDLEALLELREGEMAFAVFGRTNFDGTLEELTKAIPMDAESAEVANGVTYSSCFVRVPNSILTAPGMYGVSVQIKIPFLSQSGEMRYRLATSCIAEFTVDESYDTEFQGYEQTTTDIFNSKLNNHESRVSALEEVNFVKVLKDVTISEEVLTKFYTDGSTSTEHIASGGSGAIAIVANGFVVLEFTESSFNPAQDGKFCLAFSKTQTTMRDNNFIACFDKAANATFEAEETTALAHAGALQTANTLFKGSDGCVFIEGVKTPFAGKLILYNGKIKSNNELIVGVTYDINTNSITIENIAGDVQVIQLPMPAATQRYVQNVNISDWVGETKPFTCAVPFAVHGKGAEPAVHARGYAYSVAENGDITFCTNTKKQAKFIIL